MAYYQRLQAVCPEYGRVPFLNMARWFTVTSRFYGGSASLYMMAAARLFRLLTLI
jgi:hypothetical protein